ncbi:MAG: transposase [Nitrosomonas sp.]|nr:transposase [Nitrosomonas sp.]
MIRDLCAVTILEQIDELIGWPSIGQELSQRILQRAAGRLANSNLHMMRFLGLPLQVDVPDHSVLSRFRTRLTAADVWMVY